MVRSDFRHRSDAPSYDRNGNLIYDGSFWLQYDAFNRLCQVHPAGGLDPNSFNANGSLKDPNAAPAWIARYVHDAFGRLMRKRAPHPGDPDKKVTDEYYYDGVRRIQTKTTWQAVGGWPSGSAWQEYVYGPDYVDEFVAFVDDPLGAGVGTYYTLQDANYNLMATLRANANDGGPGGGTLTASNVVLRQYQWSPYGAPVVAETLTENLPSAVTEAQAAAAGRIGHQGLFFERYDSGADEPGIAANAAGIYYNRARFYTPYLGRFLQKDMNAAGLPVVAALAFNAAALDAFLDAFDAQSHYGDGLNLYAYLGSNPVGRRDPSGLVYDPFEDVDDVIAGLWAERAEAAQGVYDAFGGMFQAAAKMALQATMEGLVVSLVPGGALLVGAYHAANGAIDIYDNGLGWMNALELAGGGAGMVGALRRGMGAFNAGRTSVRMQRAGVSLPVLQRYCFVAGTLVLMEGGTFRSIELLRPGDDVFSLRDPLAPVDPEFMIAPEQWRIIHLEMADSNCETAYVSLLRPVEWLEMAIEPDRRAARQDGLGRVPSEDDRQRRPLFAPQPAECSTGRNTAAGSFTDQPPAAASLTGRATRVESLTDQATPARSAANRARPCGEAASRRPPRGAAMAWALGALITLSLPEMGLHGPAEVVGVEPCPAHLAGPATGIVTGTFERTAPATLDLQLEGLFEPIGTTSSHPLWSLDCEAWVAAGDLQPGETLGTLHGPTTVVRIESHDFPQTVYNIEVSGDHTYFVTDKALWVHNSYTDTLNSLAKRWLGQQSGSRRIPAHRYHDIQQRGVSRLWEAVEDGKFSMDDLVNGKVRLSMTHDGDLIANGDNLGTIIDIY